MRAHGVGDLTRSAGEPAPGTRVLFYDGLCPLCDGAVRFVAARDRHGRFRFEPLQGSMAAALVPAEAAATGADSGTVVLWEDGTTHRKSEAVLRTLAALGGVWKVLAMLSRLVPRFLRDAVYGVVSRNRSRWFGRRDCLLPPPGPASGAKTRLSSTSALVLLWAGREHLETARAREYLDGLDLGEGLALFRACNAICPYYAEVIRNRKHGVREFIEGCIAEAGASGTQVVIAGAGLDPLGIDLVETHPGVRVFELDRDNMERKAALHAAVGGGSNPAFVTADLASAPGARDALRAAGWDPARPTVLVLEGISYYLEPAELRDLVAALSPVRVVVEYLKPEGAIAADRARIPAEVFAAIAGECDLPAIRRHDSEGLARLLDMRVRERRGMTALERARTGESRHFPADESGWIEMCLLIPAEAP